MARGMGAPPALPMSAARCSTSGWMTRWASSIKRSASSRRVPPASVMRAARRSPQAAALRSPVMKVLVQAVRAALARAV